MLHLFLNSTNLSLPAPPHLFHQNCSFCDQFSLCGLLIHIVGILIRLEAIPPPPLLLTRETIPCWSLEWEFKGRSSQGSAFTLKALLLHFVHCLQGFPRLYPWSWLFQTHFSAFNLARHCLRTTGSWAAFH
jgi:hypothetical protein